MHSLTNGLPLILCKGFPIDLISVSGFNYGRLKIRNGLFTLTQRFDRDQNQYRGRNIQERCDEVQVTHAPSCSLERSKYNEIPTKTRTNKMTAYIYQQPNDDGIIFVNVRFTDQSTGVVIVFESLPLLDRDSKSDLTKSGIEEAKRLAKLLIDGHFD